MINHLWRAATLLESKLTAKNVKSLKFSVQSWLAHEPGQHYDIRLTAPSGYQAERSYSAASPPEEKDVVEFGVELIEGGEVSPYLWAMEAGEQVEIRGPIGGHFVWNIKTPGPLGLIGGGSGMVPLMSMLRHYVRHREKDLKREIIFLISVRTMEHLLYREELSQIENMCPNVRIILTITDTPPPNWNGYSRRIDPAMMHDIFLPWKDRMPMLYACGPTAFVEKAANLLVEAGFNSHEIKTERFG